MRQQQIGSRICTGITSAGFRSSCSTHNWCPSAPRP
jgi:hypothetical protein